MYIRLVRNAAEGRQISAGLRCRNTSSISLQESWFAFRVKRNMYALSRKIWHSFFDAALCYRCSIFMALGFVAFFPGIRCCWAVIDHQHYDLCRYRYRLFHKNKNALEPGERSGRSGQTCAGPLPPPFAVRIALGYILLYVFYLKNLSPVTASAKISALDPWRNTKWTRITI